MTEQEHLDFCKLLIGQTDLRTVQLVLDAYVAAKAGPNALDQVEQLEDWTFGGLMQHVLATRDGVPELDAGGLMRLRSYQLLGLLADACEQAMLDGDLKTAMAMSRLANMSILRIKGEQTLAAAFGLDELDTEAEA